VPGRQLDGRERTTRVKHALENESKSERQKLIILDKRGGTLGAHTRRRSDMTHISKSQTWTRKGKTKFFFGFNLEQRRGGEGAEKSSSKLILRMNGCERATRSLPPQLPGRIGRSLWFWRFFPSCARALASVGWPRLVASITCEVFLGK